MKTMTIMEINIQGRFTMFPGKEAVINNLNNAKEVKLRVERDYDNQIILVDCATDEPAGCIPPNPSYIEKYEELAKVVDSKERAYIKVEALNSVNNNKHYRVRLTF